MDERTSVMASGSVAQSLGFIAGPGMMTADCFPGHYNPYSLTPIERPRI